MPPRARQTGGGEGKGKEAKCALGSEKWRFLSRSSLPGRKPLALLGALCLERGEARRLAWRVGGWAGVVRVLHSGRCKAGSECGPSGACSLLAR